MIDHTKSPAEKEVLEIERLFKAPPERVFDAFGSADAMKTWFGPGYCGVVSADLDFQVGGSYKLRLNTEHAGEVDLVGTYQVVDRPNRLSLTWRWEDNPAFNPCDSVVDIMFEKHPEGTLLHLRHSGLDRVADRENHGHGWNGAFDKLEKIFT